MPSHSPETIVPVRTAPSAAEARRRALRLRHSIRVEIAVRRSVDAG